MKTGIKNGLKKALMFIANPRLLLCFLLAWMITNGWSYIALGLGAYYKISWLASIASAYLAFLWLPVSPEKIVTFGIAIVLLRKLFPNDTKTLSVLKDLHKKAKSAISKRKLKKQKMTSNKGCCSNE